ncbi:MAG TPA: hypothetical protein VNJ02_10550 [Vicinamibacterales bacterium]|nr:hypothetical protein [Vicinamibacterales bacterium]
MSFRAHRASQQTVAIDGEVVRLEVARVTVHELAQLARLVSPRGSRAPSASLRAVLHLARVAAIDAHVTAPSGDVLIDEVVMVDGLGTLLGGREDLVTRLFSAVLDAQQLSSAERDALVTATRFSLWLDEARANKVGSSWLETGTNCQTCHELQLCARRGCDGSTKKRVVWHHGPLVLKTCPVLSFTPEIENALRVFYWTHEVTTHPNGAVRWQRTSLPAAGGLDEQNAWLMSALGCVHQTHLEVMHEQHKGGARE